MKIRSRGQIESHFENFVARGEKTAVLSLLVLFICSFALIGLLKLGAGALDSLADGNSNM